jgi:hypothetical protein
MKTFIGLMLCLGFYAGNALDNYIQDYEGSVSDRNSSIESILSK